MQLPSAGFPGISFMFCFVLFWFFFCQIKKKIDALFYRNLDTLKCLKYRNGLDKNKVYMTICVRDYLLVYGKF